MSTYCDPQAAIMHNPVQWSLLYVWLMRFLCARLRTTSFLSSSFRSSCIHLQRVGSLHSHRVIFRPYWAEQQCGVVLVCFPLHRIAPVPQPPQSWQSKTKNCLLLIFAVCCCLCLLLHIVSSHRQITMSFERTSNYVTELGALRAVTHSASVKDNILHNQNGEYVVKHATEIYWQQK